YELHPSAEYAVVREHAATPIDVLLVASVCENGHRNEPTRFIRSLERTVSKDNLTVLPSSIRLHFVGKLHEVTVAAIWGSQMTAWLPLLVNPRTYNYLGHTFLFPSITPGPRVDLSCVRFR